MNTKNMVLKVTKEHRKKVTRLDRATISYWHVNIAMHVETVKVIHRRICLILAPGQILLDYLGKRL